MTSKKEIDTKTIDNFTENSSESKFNNAISSLTSENSVQNDSLLIGSGNETHCEFEPNALKSNNSNCSHVANTLLDLVENIKFSNNEPNLSTSALNERNSLLRQSISFTDSNDSN